MSGLSCEEIREEMLVAEMDELRGIGESDVAQHVRTCDACAAVARRILAGHAQIDAAMTTLTRSTAKKKQRVAAWIPIPLAAAAVIALLMIPRMQDDALPNMDAITRLMFQEEPIVAPAAGQQAMVLEKNDMTIVWLYSQETE